MGRQRDHGDDILLILDWDGKAITGMINPGTDNMALTTASLEPHGWVVKFEADGKDKSGAAIHYVIEGRSKISSCRIARSSARGETSGARRVRDEPAMRTRSIAIARARWRGCSPAVAHHAVEAKFDETKPMTLTGIVTFVDWRNPHVHVFVNVTARTAQ